MNFDKRIQWIRSSLETASAKRTVLLVKIPVLRAKFSALKKELDSIEREMDRIDDKYGRMDGNDHEWGLLVDVLDTEAYKVEDARDQAELELEEAKYSLDDIEASVEAASYDARDAARS